MMERGITLIRVADPERAVRFYRDVLGLPSEGVAGFVADGEGPIRSHTRVELCCGLINVLFSPSDLPADANFEALPSMQPKIIVGYLVSSKAEVDTLLARAQAAGATVIDRPRDRPWGSYSAYFRDPDGCLWEIIRNPQMSPQT